MPGRKTYASVHKQIIFKAPHSIVAAIALLLAVVYAAGGASAASAPDPDAGHHLLSPPGTDGKLTPVTLEMRVTNISDIDEVSQHFKMVGYLIAHRISDRPVERRSAGIHSQGGLGQVSHLFGRRGLVSTLRFRQRHRAALGVRREHPRVSGRHGQVH